MNERIPRDLLGPRGQGVVDKLREDLKEAKLQVEKWEKSYSELKKKHEEVCDKLQLKVIELTVKEEGLKDMI